MKLILYIISVLLLFYCVSAGGSPTKQDVDISELQTDVNLEDALHYGINWIFKQAALKSGISGLVMGITKVNKIQKWKQGGSTYYYFDVEAANDDVNITSVYNVKCDSKGVLSVVSKWSYNIGKKDDKPDKNIDTPEEEGHKNRCKEGKEVDASQIEKDEHLKDALDFGINWIFEKAAEKFNIYESDIEINKVNILCKWEENGNIHYYFDVEAANYDNITLNATYNVKCDPEGNLIVVNKWHYNVHFNGKCKEVEVVEIEKDSQLKNALIYGITRIFHKATRKFGISDLGIVVTKVNSMCSYKGIGDTYYSFDAEAVNDHGDIVYTSYKVKYESKTRNLRAVDEWKYNIQYNHQEELTNDYEDQGNHNNYDDKYDMEPHVPLKVEIELNLY